MKTRRADVRAEILEQRCVWVESERAAFADLIPALVWHEERLHGAWHSSHETRTPIDLAKFRGT